MTVNKINNYNIKAILLSMAFCTSVPQALAMTNSDFTNIKQTILELGRSTTVNPPAAARVLPLADENSNRSKLDETFVSTLQKCEGRIDNLALLSNTQVRFSEKIAMTGALLGVIGTVATCPHCAAFMSGLAGVANGVQSIFSQFNDTPQSTQTRITNLSNQIKSEVDDYMKLPQPVPGTGDFQKNLLQRSDKLLLLATSCLIFSNTYPNGTDAGSGSGSGAGAGAGTGGK